MLRRPNSQTPFFGVLAERECPRCHRPVELPLGELCGHCRADIARRASRIARLVAGASTAVVAVYVILRIPGYPTARAVGAAAVLMWYVLSYLIVRRTLETFLS
jgi:hypothetical protein